MVHIFYSKDYSDQFPLPIKDASSTVQSGKNTPLTIIDIIAGNRNLDLPGSGYWQLEEP